MSNRSRLWNSLLLGTFLFVLSNTAVWSAWLHPPSGYKPLFLIRSHDMAEYATYLTVASDPTWLAPDLHAPWTLKGGFFHPLLLVPGRIGYWLGLSPALTFQAAFFFFCIAGACSLLYAVDFFLPTARQRWWSLAVVASSVPLALLAIVIKPLLPFPSAFYGIGMVQLAYGSSDGLFRGGLSNSYTNSCGTIAILLALTFTAKRIASGQLRYRYLAALTMFLSALLHPFEFFVMVPASAAALLWAAKRSGKWREAVTDCGWNIAAAITGLVPTLYLAFRYQWISDLSTVFTERMYPTWLLAMYGLPCIFVVYCLLLRYRPSTISDQVLMIWWVTTAVIVCLPYCPYPPHLLNGFVYVTAILLIRLLFEHSQTRSLYQARPKLVLGLSSAAVAVSLAAFGALHVQLWKDGRSTDPELLLTALTSRDEQNVATWLHSNAGRQDLVLAPPDLAPWFTPVPMHTFASHVLRSFNYTQQLKEASAFYQGESSETAHGLIESYGVRWVVAPSGSPALRYFSDPPAAEIGNLRVYEIPGNQMKPYPGLAHLVSDTGDVHSLSRLVMEAKAGISSWWEYFRGKPRV